MKFFFGIGDLSEDREEKAYQFWRSESRTPKNHQRVYSVIFKKDGVVCHAEVGQTLKPLHAINKWPRGWSQHQTVLAIYDGFINDSRVVFVYVQHPPDSLNPEIYFPAHPIGDHNLIHITYFDDL